MRTLADGGLTDIAGLNPIWLSAIVISLGLACSFTMLALAWSERRRATHLRGEVERMNQLKAEMEQVAQAITARLEARTKAAEDLLVRAERTIASLDRTAATLRNVIADPKPVPAREPASTQAQVPVERQTAFAPTIEIPLVEPPPKAQARAAVAPIELKPAPAKPAPAADAWSQAGTQAILELATAGLNPVQIAQKLGRPTGQIELILSLQKVGISAAR